MTDVFQIPPPPDAVRVAMITSTWLSVAKLAAGAGIMGGAWAASLPAEKVSALVSFALFALSLASAIIAWVGSLMQHRREAAQAREREVAAATVSAALGVPVTITVTPPGSDNIATKISAKETALAPDVPLDVQPRSPPSVVQ